MSFAAKSLNTHPFTLAHLGDNSYRGEVEMWRGGGRYVSTVGRPFRLAVPQSTDHNSVSTSRLSNRTGPIKALVLGSSPSRPTIKSSIYANLSVRCTETVRKLGWGTFSRRGRSAGSIPQ